jgi:hypothetical protein
MRKRLWKLIRARWIAADAGRRSMRGRRAVPSEPNARADAADVCELTAIAATRGVLINRRRSCHDRRR